MSVLKFIVGLTVFITNILLKLKCDLTPLSKINSGIICIIILATGYKSLGQDPVERGYAQESIYLQSGSFIKQGERYESGFLGGRLKKEMEVSPEALSEFRKFQTRAVIGSVLRITGLALIASVSGADTVEGKDRLLAAGLTISIISIPIRGSAANKLHKSVWIRNRDVLR